VKLRRNEFCPIHRSVFCCVICAGTSDHWGTNASPFISSGRNIAWAFG